MLKLSNLKIDQEFEAQISPLSFDELQQLERNILRDRRLVDPIIVWNGYILDGHNRYAILRKHPFIEYEIRELEFASRQEALVWICNHQLGRRNLTPERKKFLIGKRYEAEKQIDNNRGNQYTAARKDAADQIDPQKNRSSRHVTRQRIAKETNSSEGYVQRAEKYMHGVEAAEDAVPGAKEEILSGHIKATDREICSIAKIPELQRPEAVAELQKPKKERDKSILSALPETAADQDTFLDVECSRIDALLTKTRASIEEYKKLKQVVITQAVTKGVRGKREMKESGVEWIGEIPREWEIAPMKHFIDILPGYAFSSNDFSSEDGVPLLRGINVGVNEIRWDETVRWNHPISKQIDSFSLKVHDLVVGLDRPWISDGTRVAFISEKEYISTALYLISIPNTGLFL